MDKRYYSISWIFIFVYALFITVKMTGDIIPINLYLISSIALIFALIRFLNRFANYKINLSKNLFTVGILLLYAVVSLSWTRAPIYGVQKMFILLSIVIISYFQDELIVKRSNQFIKLFSIGSCLILLWYLSINGFRSIDLNNKYFRLDVKDQLNPIVISRYFCFSIITYLFYLGSLKRKLHKLIIYCLIVILLILAFLTGSKGPLLSLFISFFLPVAIANRFKFRLTFKTAILILIGILALSYVILPLISNSQLSSLSQFVERRYWGEDAAGSATTRLEILKFSFDHIANQSLLKLILGNGIGDFGFLFTHTDQSMYPHNILIEILYELGVLGLALFLFIIIKVIKFNAELGVNYNSNSPLYGTLRFLFTAVYFSLCCAMTSGDLAGNFLVFVSIIFLYKAKSFYISYRRSLQADTSIIGTGYFQLS